MKNRKLKSNDKMVSFFMKLFIGISIIFPLVTKPDIRNTVFILSNLICFILMMACLFRKSVTNKHKIFYKVFILLIILYNLIFAYYNILYHHYFIEQINKTISFTLLLVLIKKINNDFLRDNKIIEFLIMCIMITSIGSIIYYFLGGDAINIENFDIIFRKQGVFVDKRLTWVFGHKSSYGLMLVLFLSIIIRYKDLFKSKIIFLFSIFTIVFTIFLTGSSSTLGLTFILLLFSVISKYKFKRNIILTIFLVIIGALVSYFAAIYIYDIISEGRNITTLGNRTYIYGAAKYYLGMYPHGIGKEFGNLIFTYEIMHIDNFHNIFLNEMLRFSILVGVIYTLIFITIAFYSTIKHRIWAIGIWFPCFGLFFMDFSLRTDMLSIFMFLQYLLFFANQNEVVNLLKENRRKNEKWIN